MALHDFHFFLLCSSPQALERYIKNLETNFKAQLQREAARARENRKKFGEEEKRAEELQKALQVRDTVLCINCCALSAVHLVVCVSRIGLHLHVLCLYRVLLLSDQ